MELQLDSKKANSNFTQKSICSSITNTEFSGNLHQEERYVNNEDEGPVVVVSGDEGERGVGGRDSEGEGSVVMDTSGDSDMEGVGWVARGESETEGFSDGVVDRDRVVRRGRGGDGGEVGRRKRGQENSV